MTPFQEYIFGGKRRPFCDEIKTVLSTFNLKKKVFCVNQKQNSKYPCF